jgi:hypothetical protein
MKRGTEDLDFFIGDEALAASAGPGMWEPSRMECAKVGIYIDFTKVMDSIILYGMDK